MNKTVKCNKDICKSCRANEHREYWPKSIRHSPCLDIIIRWRYTPKSNKAKKTGELVKPSCVYYMEHLLSSQREKEPFEFNIS